MPCYYPLEGWRAKSPNLNGKYPVVFKQKLAQIDDPIKLACGQCIGCRLERSRQWAMRCVHESTLHSENCFITLTYSSEHLPTNQSLRLQDWQKFMKRLRKKYHPRKIRYFMCGEYGENQDTNSLQTIGRPHYHALLFGLDFADKIEAQTTLTGDILYNSKILDDTWGMGITTIGELTFESAAYVARYCMKKINGDEAEEHYETFDRATGEIEQLKPEFTTQSSNPGIARKWFEQYKTDLDKGFITMNGIKMPPPKYYDRLYNELDEEHYMFIKQKRLDQIDPDNPDNTRDRLKVRENIKRRKLNQLPRNQI